VGAGRAEVMRLGSGAEAGAQEIGVRARRRCWAGAGASGARARVAGGLSGERRSSALGERLPGGALAREQRAARRRSAGAAQRQAGWRPDARTTRERELEHKQWCGAELGKWQAALVAGTVRIGVRSARGCRRARRGGNT
jgi:hypothetical protein